MGMISILRTLSCLLLLNGVNGKLSIIGSFTIAFVVFGICAVNCWLMDQITNYWGAMIHTQLFLIVGLIGTSVGSVCYAWLAFTQPGHLLVDRVFGGYFLLPRVTTQ